MVSENTFEFEHSGDQMRFIGDGDHVKRERIYVDPQSGKRSWITEYPIDGRDVPGIRALLAERTRRAGVFARLMDMAREMSMAQNYVYDDKLDALQREWDIAPPKGGAK